MNDQANVRWQGKFLRVVQAGRWEYADRVNTSGAVAIVAVTEEGKLILTEQYRIPMGKRVIELPAGLVGDLDEHATEDFAEAARRELLEETGYQAGAMVRLASGPPSAGLASEIVVFFQASELRRLTQGGGDDHEDIQVHEIPLAMINQWLRDQSGTGVLVDPKIYAGLYLANEEAAGRGLPNPPPLAR